MAYLLSYHDASLNETPSTKLPFKADCKGVLRAPDVESLFLIYAATL